ncbi:uncharacterized protein CTRU02_213405 [Colletotrichum truncatum]|uniref:Uncharacterized protein n=1 Tax=Colletotrichum truncatum TaxID=5467 RepID=A0ACC3YKY4_COLTU|nr:uncharacterized protein CTRU02_13402 [Colletotrichum truncatum]KAF6783412.1 hypothetical protein CTRU02_13402 [Colletotrichum truncatum]
MSESRSERLRAIEVLLERTVIRLEQMRSARPILGQPAQVTTEPSAEQDTETSDTQELQSEQDVIDEPSAQQYTEPSDTEELQSEQDAIDKPEVTVLSQNDEDDEPHVPIAVAPTSSIRCFPSGHREVVDPMSSYLLPEITAQYAHLREAPAFGIIGRPIIDDIRRDLVADQEVEEFGHLPLQSLGHTVSGQDNTEDQPTMAQIHQRSPWQGFSSQLPLPVSSHAQFPYVPYHLTGGWWEGCGVGLESSCSVPRLGRPPSWAVEDKQPSRVQTPHSEGSISPWSLLHTSRETSSEFEDAERTIFRRLWRTNEVSSESQGDRMDGVLLEETV